MRNRIVFLDGATFGHSFDFSRLEELGDLKVFASTSAGETVERLKDSTVVITNKVKLGRNHLETCSTMKLICVAATGTNNVDLKAAEELGICVCNVSGYASKSVAQHTLAMALSLLHSLPYHHAYATSGDWSESPFFTHMENPFAELGSLCWGILGMGSIGKEVARLVSAFGAEVLYTSTSGEDRASYERCELDDLLRRSTILSIHAPLTKRTQSLISERELRLLGPSGILLNVGRGGIIDEADLMRALECGWILAAGLDVLDEEPPKENNPLFRLRDSGKLLVTPHCAWAGSRLRLFDELFKNIESFLRGGSRNLIV